MSRRRQATKKPLQVDGKFHNALVSRLVNTVMKSGKKNVAQRIVYGALDQIATKNPASNPLEIFQRAVDNAKPRLEVKPRRVGGATYQVPVDIRAERRMALAIRWLLRSARARGGKTMAEKLAAELLDAASGQGATIKRREDTHRMAEANRAFVHYRW